MSDPCVWEAKTTMANEFITDKKTISCNLYIRDFVFTVTLLWIDPSHEMQLLCQFFRPDYSKGSVYLLRANFGRSTEILSASVPFFHRQWVLG